MQFETILNSPLSWVDPCARTSSSRLTNSVLDVMNLSVCCSEGGIIRTSLHGARHQ